MIFSRRKKNVSVGRLIRVTPGGGHGYFETSAGIVRKSLGEAAERIMNPVVEEVAREMPRLKTKYDGGAGYQRPSSWKIFWSWIVSLFT